MLAALAAVLIGASAAQAGGVETGDCIFGRHGFSCAHTWRHLTNPYVIHIAPPATDEEIADARERDRQWRNRCHPIVKQDARGVSRYSYSAPGCEYGKFE
jgi:hypothetical protein